MKRRITPFIAIQIVVCLSIASTLSGQPFEAADVHVTTRVSQDASVHRSFIHGRFQMHNATMIDLVKFAYNVTDEKVIGGPSWLELDHFDVTARTPAATSVENVRTMLQALLADRFRLVVKNEERPVPVYVLAQGRREPQMKASSGAGSAQAACDRTSEPGPVNSRASCHGITMTAFAESLHSMAGAYFDYSIVDKTGIKGAWDFELRWSGRGQLPNVGSDGISVFDAVDKQLGLKLDLQKLPTPVVVVVGVNRVPTANPAGTDAALPPLPVEFEVVNIKPSAPGTNEDLQIQPGGRIRATAVSMKDLISFAWNTEDTKMVGGPPWLETSKFDIVAKAPAAVAGETDDLDEESIQPMVRAMLIDRFKIVTHEESRPVPVYVLSASKSGIKATKADPAGRASCRFMAAQNAPPTMLTRRYVCTNITMTQFAEQLRGMAGNYIDAPAVDATGLEGAWDFVTSWTPLRLMTPGAGRGGENSAAGAATAPNGGLTMFEALDRQLGLKLEQQKRNMKVLVIDHVEPKPTDN